MKPKTLILADQNGTPEALIEDHDGELCSGLGTYRVMSSMPEILVLRRSGEENGDRSPGRVLMAGEILSESTVLDVVNVIISSRWAGTLHVHGPDAHRSFGFDKGALRHATTDHPEDRLDKILFRVGVLTPSQAESVMREIKPDQRCGEVLGQRGLIERQKLFEHLQKQTEEAFFSAVFEREGGYLFCVAGPRSPAPSLIANIPAQQLLFQAAERLDQLKDFQRLIPDDRARPDVEPEVDLARLRPRSRLVLGYCDGSRSVREVASETWLGRFHTLRILHSFLLKGQVRLLEPARTTREVADSLAAPFEQALREIFDAASRNGSAGRLHRELREKMDENEHRAELRGIVGQDGDVDAESISSWLRDLEVRDRVEVVGHALHELASFALFNASLSLPRSEERELTRKVNAHLQAIGNQ